MAECRTDRSIYPIVITRKLAEKPVARDACNKDKVVSSQTASVAKRAACKKDKTHIFIYRFIYRHTTVRLHSFSPSNFRIWGPSGIESNRQRHSD